MKTFKFAGAMAIGELNSKRIELLRDILREDFPLMGKPSNLANALLFINQSANDNLLISDSQISYTLQGDKALMDFDHLIGIVNKICETLVLNGDFTQCMFDFANIVDAPNGNAFIFSKGIIKDNALSEDILGIGYRYFIKKESGLWEFKVEPFIQDPHKLYIEGICNFSAIQTNTNKLKELGTNALQDFSKRYEAFRTYANL